MRETRVKIKNKTGLHARPASEFVRVAKQFQSKITIVKGDASANAKSIVNVLVCSITQGDEMLIRAQGPDETDAIQTLAAFIDTLEE